jgi:4-hydroxyphenylpyruvate dioxygenase-like putative hemolysin
MIGQVQLELLEPLDDESIYARFLAERGEGVHHIAVASPTFDKTVQSRPKGATASFSAACSVASGSRTSQRIANSA